MTCRPCKGNMKFLILPKESSTHQAPICDMVPERFRHRPDNGLKNYFGLGIVVLFILYHSFRGSWI